jgi:GNAT superfamily N-acetyltransferase
MIEIVKFSKFNLDDVYDLITLTIKKSYPKIYPTEVVNYFLEYHSKSEILCRAKSGKLFIVKIDQLIIGTGFLDGEELGGVYVHPDFQRLGYGIKIVEHLLAIARENKIKKVHLDSTPIAKPMYEKLGFQLISPAVQMIGKVPLDYFIMEKIIN